MRQLEPIFGGIAACLLLASVGTEAQAGAEALPALGADINATSVSGLSSGAYMAGQLEIAHSSHVVGAGIVAGGPYGCAESSGGRLFPFWPTAVLENAELALYGCMKVDWGKPDPAALASRARALASSGDIDPLSGLANDKVYLFSGNEDQTVARAVVEAAEGFYRDAGLPADNVTLVEREGGHALLTTDKGNACPTSEKPFLDGCQYDQARAILEWIYGSLEPPVPTPAGRFVVFDQTGFSDPADGLADEGVLYVPPGCAEQSGCRVHVVLHGCNQAREAVGDDFVKQSGFAEMADQNRFVILFPQVKASTLNPQGCWDWWGYTGVDFLAKDAPQIAAIWGMVERLTTRR